jgi:hypothetical protein
MAVHLCVLRYMVRGMLGYRLADEMHCIVTEEEYPEIMTLYYTMHNHSESNCYKVMYGYFVKKN